MTLISRIFGYIRDVVFAVVVGASAGPGADAFIIAFRIPNFLRRLFAEGGFAVAFVPVISEYRSQRSKDDVRQLAANVSGVLGTILLVVTVIGMLAAPVIITVFAPGFLDQPDKYTLAVELLRITFPYIFFISMTAFAGGLLNTYDHFSVPAFTPVLLNFSIIGCAIWLAPYVSQPVYALAWGVLLGGLVQMLFQVPFLYRLGLLVMPRFRIRDEGVRKIFRLMLPAMFGVSVSQINLLIDTLLASFLVTGSVSWLYYSDRMVEFPLGVFGIALATAMLPTLSRNFASGDHRAFSAHMDWALRLTLLIGIPASVGLAFLAGPVLLTLFQYGEFTTTDVRMAAMSLSAYSIGLLGFMCVKILAPGFFARQDTRTPVRIAVIAMVANMFMNVALIFTLEHVGLALATSLGALLNTGLLYRALRKRDIYQPADGWVGFILRVLLATIGMAVALWVLVPELSNWFPWSALERGIQLGQWVLLGVAIYIGLLLVSGLRLASLSRK